MEVSDFLLTFFVWGMGMVRVIFNIRWCVLPKSDTFGQEIKIALVIDNESRDLQLYNDSFRILIGRAKAELTNL